MRVNGQPVAQPRPSVRIMPNKFEACIGLLNGGAARAYRNLRRCVRGNAYVAENHAVHPWRRKLSAALKSAIGEIITQPVEVRCVFLMTRRTNMIWTTKPMPREAYDKSVNDGDNLLKAVLDAGNDAGIWLDDGQVIDGSFSRRYASGYEEPGVEITIRILDKEAVE